MGRKCSVCIHKSASHINHLLISGVSTGDIANDFAVGVSAVQRHFRRHVSARVNEHLLPRPRKVGRPRKDEAQTGVVITPADRQRTEIAVAELARYEPRRYYLRQLDRVENIADQAERDDSPNIVLNAVESSRRLYSDAIGLFSDTQVAPSGDESQLLTLLDDAAQSSEERAVLARLLLRLDGIGLDANDAAQ